MSAVFSPCRRYRYALCRRMSADGHGIWFPGGLLPERDYVAFIGLNPSTADEMKDDPTIRRCCGFAKAWGFNAIVMLNLFAFRATDPKDMKAAADPVGPENDMVLTALAARAALVVAAWGNNGLHRMRGVEVCRLIRPLHCLRLTSLGDPAHPLRLPRHLTPVPWDGYAASHAKVVAA